MSSCVLMVISSFVGVSGCCSVVLDSSLSKSGLGFRNEYVLQLFWVSIRLFHRARRRSVLFLVLVFKVAQQELGEKKAS